MLTAIEFKYDEISKENQDNIFSGIERDVIILCPDATRLKKIAFEIIHTVNGCAEYMVL